MDLEDVVPAVHAWAFLDERRGAPGEGPGASRYYREPLVEGLVVAYVEAAGADARILREDEVARLSLASGGLRKRAIENLRRRLHSVERLGGPDVYMISAGGTYEASLVLVDGFWNAQKLRVDGDFVVALPSRDILMVTGSNYPLGIARLRQLARESLEQTRDPVTADLLVRREGTWSVLPAWTSTRPAPRARRGLGSFLGGLFGGKPAGDG